MKIYRILENGYYGGEIEIPDGTPGIPLYTTRTIPPDIPEGKFAFWNNSGKWVIIDEPPMLEPPPSPESTPTTTGEADFPPT